MNEEKMESSAERSLGVKLFNETWKLIDKEDRTDAENLLMIHTAHASAYHWSQAPESNPSTSSISEWQVAHVYTILNRCEPALFHAQLCLRICEENSIGDWQLAFAYESVARAAAACGDCDLFEAQIVKAKEIGANIRDQEDREHFKAELSRGPWFGFAVH